MTSATIDPEANDDAQSTTANTVSSSYSMQSLLEVLTSLSKHFDEHPDGDDSIPLRAEFAACAATILRSYDNFLSKSVLKYEPSEEVAVTDPNDNKGADKKQLEQFPTIEGVLRYLEQMCERIPLISTLPTSYTHVQLGFLSFSTTDSQQVNFANFVIVVPDETQTISVEFPMNLVTLATDPKSQSKFDLGRLIEIFKLVVAVNPHAAVVQSHSCHKELYRCAFVALDHPHFYPTFKMRTVENLLFHHTTLKHIIPRETLNTLSTEAHQLQAPIKMHQLGRLLTEMGLDSPQQPKILLCSSNAKFYDANSVGLKWWKQKKLDHKPTKRVQFNTTAVLFYGVS